MKTWIVIADEKSSTFMECVSDDFSDAQTVIQIPFPDHPEPLDFKFTSHSVVAEIGDELENSQLLFRQFSRQIVDELEQAMLDKEFERLILIANSQILSLIHIVMSNELSRLVELRLDIEMMKEPSHVIRARLQSGVFRHNPGLN